MHAVSHVPCLSFLQPTGKVTDKQHIEVIVFSDLDGTWISKEEETLQLNVWWKSYAMKRSAMLVYNTGRPIEIVQSWMQKKHIPPVDLCICCDGSNIYHQGSLWKPWKDHLASNGCTLHLLDHLEAALQIWMSGRTTFDISPDRSEFSLRYFVYSLDKTFQVRGYCALCDYIRGMNLPGLHLYAYTVKEMLELVETDDWNSTLWGIELRVSSSVAHSSKGPAAQFVYDQICSKQSIKPYVLWAGDADNDMGLLEDTDFDGIIVANASDALRDACRQETGSRCVFHSSKKRSLGVLEGLKFLLP